MADTPLPEPESEQLAALVGSGSLRLVYGLLHRRLRNPPTADEIRFFLQSAAASDSSADRALRGLMDYFDITPVQLDGAVRYQLRGWAGRRRLTSCRSARAFAPRSWPQHAALSAVVH